SLATYIRFRFCPPQSLRHQARSPSCLLAVSRKVGKPAGIPVGCELPVARLRCRFVDRSLRETNPEPTGLEPATNHLATNENLFFPLAITCSMMHRCCHEMS